MGNIDSCEQYWNRVLNTDTPMPAEALCDLIEAKCQEDPVEIKRLLFQGKNGMAPGIEFLLPMRRVFERQSRGDWLALLSPYISSASQKYRLGNMFYGVEWSWTLTDCPDAKVSGINRGGLRLMISALAEDPLVSYSPANEDTQGICDFFKIADAMLIFKGDDKKTAKALEGWGRTFLPETKGLVWSVVGNGRLPFPNEFEKPELYKAVRSVIHTSLESIAAEDLLFLSEEDALLPTFIKKVASFRDIYLSRSLLENLRRLSDPLLKEVPALEKSVGTCTASAVSLMRLLSYACETPQLYEQEETRSMRIYRQYRADLKGELGDACNRILPALAHTVLSQEFCIN